MNEMKDSEFKRMFRMSRRAFQNLLDKVSPELSVDENQATRGSGSPNLPQTALAATIRWLAGGSYLDICALFGLDFHNFFNRNYVLWKTITILDNVLTLGINFSDDEELEQTFEEFGKLCDGRMRGCAMAIDGWVCKTRKPTTKEVGISIKNYRNRKGCWGLVVLAGCDALCRFNYLSARTSGFLPTITFVREQKVSKYARITYTCKIRANT